MKNKFTVLLSMLLLCTLLSGCAAGYYGGIKERTDGLQNAYTADILPQSVDNAAGDTVGATLYFRYLSEDMLVGVEREFHVTAENTLEELIVQALIDGPQDDSYQYSALINSDTEIVSIKEQSGYLSVTLSSEFAERTDQDIESDAMRRRLAVQSIVNSVVSVGNYSRVLILVDKSGTGNGERLTYAEAGWEEYGESPMEPMGLDTDVILTPENVLEIVMRAMVEKDYERMEFYLASRDYDGTVRPDYADFTEILDGKASVVGYEQTMPAVVSGNGDRAIATVAITYIDAGGKTVQLDEIPVRLIREGVWKVSFSALQDMFPEY